MAAETLKHRDKAIYVAGSGGMVGRGVTRALESRGYDRLITRTSGELDLIDQSAVQTFFSAEKPEIVILAAAKVGGILANDTYRADFIYNNLMIEANVIHAAHEAGVEKLIFLGSSCIYPRLAPQPMAEEALLTGPLEPTNEPYAIAKIAGVKLCESYYRQYGANFYSLMPTNLYGPHDNFNAATSHVIPALIRRFHEAAAANTHEVSIWGTGRPRREFLFVDDLADAVLFFMENVEAGAIYSEGISHVNIGCGTDIEIRELAELIAEIAGFTGKIVFDTSKPDGTPRKLLDISRLNALGWSAARSLEDGLRETHDWYVRNHTAQ